MTSNSAHAQQAAHFPYDSKWLRSLDVKNNKGLAEIVEKLKEKASTGIHVQKHVILELSECIEPEGDDSHLKLKTTINDFYNIEGIPNRGISIDKKLELFAKRYEQVAEWLSDLIEMYDECHLEKSNNVIVGIMAGAVRTYLSNNRGNTRRRIDVLKHLSDWALSLRTAAEDNSAERLQILFVSEFVLGDPKHVIDILNKELRRELRALPAEVKEQRLPIAQASPFLHDPHCRAKQINDFRADFRKRYRHRASDIPDNSGLPEALDNWGYKELAAFVAKSEEQGASQK